MDSSNGEMNCKLESEVVKLGHDYQKLLSEHELLEQKYDRERDEWKTIKETYGGYAHHQSMNDMLSPTERNLISSEL
jgi:hypothetical protein